MRFNSFDRYFSCMLDNVSGFPPRALSKRMLRIYLVSFPTIPRIRYTPVNLEDKQYFIDESGKLQCYHFFV